MGLETSDNTNADTLRIEWIEGAILSGALTSCFEIDGGIHVTLYRPGETSVSERNHNTFREAIDVLINICPHP